MGIYKEIHKELFEYGGNIPIDMKLILKITKRLCDEIDELKRSKASKDVITYKVYLEYKDGTEYSVTITGETRGEVGEKVNTYIKKTKGLRTWTVEEL